MATGSMLALYLDEATAAQLAVDGGVPPAEMHVTVAYTGKAVDVDARRLRNAAEAVLDRPPLTLTISGHARFTGGPDGDVIVALVDSPDLERLRRDVVDALTEQGIALPSEHGYTAHCTLAYIDPDAPSPVTRLDPMPITFGALTVKHGNNRDDLLFADALESRRTARDLREAYATGFALSGGPMTDRVRAGCVAAVEMGLAYPGRPDLLEATLHLGHLEGVWAHIYQRRDELHAKQRAQVLAAWRDAVADLPIDDAVKVLRQDLGLTETAGQAIAAGLAGVATTAGTVAAVLLGRLRQGKPWYALRARIRDALAAARAEGVVDALALGADQAGRVGLDWDLAFTDAYRALDNLDALWVDADDWASRMVGDAAKDVGRLLADAARDGAGYDNMVSGVAGVLNSDDYRAVTLLVDYATSQAMSAGALALYTAEGVRQVDFLTAGSGVCPICVAAEERNPYPTGLAPVPAIHPNCRCTLAAVDPLPQSAFVKYLPEGAS